MVISIKYCGYNMIVISFVEHIGLLRFVDYYLDFHWM